MVLEQTGTDAVAIRDWVVEHSAWLPYEGVLRGAAGVLMDRSGNSLDRSLLLASLLEQAGYSVRLAHETLSDEDAQAILAGVSPAARDGEGAPWLATPDKVADYQAAVDRAAASLLALLPSPAGEHSAPEYTSRRRLHWWVQAVWMPGRTSIPPVWSLELHPRSCPSTWTGTPSGTCGNRWRCV